MDIQKLDLERQSAALKNKSEEKIDVTLPESANLQTENLDPKILKVLKKLDELNGTHAYWNVDWMSGQFLYQIAKLKNAKNILEIGTSTGFSTLWLAAGGNGKVYTIESSKKRYPIALQSFKEAGMEEKIELLIGHAPEIFEDLKDLKFNLVFIDCGKKYYLEIFKILEKQLNAGGVIIADNMVSHAVHMDEYFKYVRTHPDFISTLIPIGAGMEMSVKIN